MPVEYTIDKERDIVVARANGLLTPKALIEGFAKIVRATGGAAVNKDHLFVAAPLTMLHEMDSTGMTAMRESLEALHREYPGPIMRAAIVVSASDPGSGVAKLWQAIADGHPAMATKVKLFQTEATALGWLVDDKAS